MSIRDRRAKSRQDAKDNPPIRGRKFYDTPASQEKNTPYDPAIGAAMINTYKRSQGEPVEQISELPQIPIDMKVAQVQEGVYEISIPANRSIILKITAQP